MGRNGFEIGHICPITEKPEARRILIGDLPECLGCGAILNGVNTSSQFEQIEPLLQRRKIIIPIK